MRFAICDIKYERSLALLRNITLTYLVLGSPLAEVDLQMIIGQMIHRIGRKTNTNSQYCPFIIFRERSSNYFYQVTTREPKYHIPRWSPSHRLLHKLLRPLRLVVYTGDVFRQGVEVNGSLTD